MKKVFITGVAGFIGFHTAKKFLNNDFYVVGIDDLNNHYDKKMKIKRIENLKNNFKDKFQFYKTDILDKTKIEKLLKKDYDLIINLCARAGVRYSVVNPFIYFQTNTIGVINILEIMKKFKIETTLIQASTSSVYGNNNKVPFNENDKVDFPLSPYAASKKASEEICFTYHYLYNLNILVFRFFTVYGTFGRPDMSIFRFIKWIAEDEPLILYGDGEQERDFTYVDDIANAIFLALNFKGFDIINLGNDNPVKLNYVINQIENLLNKKAKINKFPAHPADVKRTCADIQKAKKILNWEPKTRIEEGLKIITDWYLTERDWVKKIKLD